MSYLVESLKRLYEKEQITKEKVKKIADRHQITPDDYELITGEKYE